jgi:hypothetical protein
MTGVLEQGIRENFLTKKDKVNCLQYHATKNFGIYAYHPALLGERYLAGPNGKTWSVQNLNG